MVSTTRQHAEDLFKRIQKRPAEAADRSNSSVEHQAQESKTARLRELRLSKEASEKSRADRKGSSR